MEDQYARQLLFANYQDSDDDLDEWGRTALPIVMTLSMLRASTAS
jgi:hypothetical protein